MQTGVKEAKILTEKSDESQTLSIFNENMEAEILAQKNIKKDFDWKRTLEKTDEQMSQVQEKLDKKKILEALKYIKDETPLDKEVGN